MMPWSSVELLASNAHLLPSQLQVNAATGGASVTDLVTVSCTSSGMPVAEKFGSAVGAATGPASVWRLSLSRRTAVMPVIAVMSSMPPLDVQRNACVDASASVLLPTT